ncbi:nuclear transport factor 2 family protein [Streptomyces albogriseolus]|uniref:nuclear transport factor 2 family protein n=1 Tax=Streptomyces albogriseolus TaxID=1887 RepID=UPI00379CB2CA
MTVPLDKCVQALDRAFAPFSTTHHAITGHVVEIDGDRATIHARVRAEHWVPEELAGGGPDRRLVVGFCGSACLQKAQRPRWCRPCMRRCGRTGSASRSWAVTPC